MFLLNHLFTEKGDLLLRQIDGEIYDVKIVDSEEKANANKSANRKAFSV